MASLDGKLEDTNSESININNVNTGTTENALPQTQFAPDLPQTIIEDTAANSEQTTNPRSGIIHTNIAARNSFVSAEEKVDRISIEFDTPGLSSSVSSLRVAAAPASANPSILITAEEEDVQLDLLSRKLTHQLKLEQERRQQQLQSQQSSSQPPSLSGEQDHTQRSMRPRSLKSHHSHHHHQTKHGQNTPSELLSELEEESASPTVASPTRAQAHARQESQSSDALASDTVRRNRQVSIASSSNDALQRMDLHIMDQTGMKLNKSDSMLPKSNGAEVSTRANIDGSLDGIGDALHLRRNDTINSNDERENNRARYGEPTEYDHLLIYTKAVTYPSIFRTIQEPRFTLRLLQMVAAGAAFLGLGITSFNYNFTSNYQMETGMNAMCFVSISSIFVSFANMFVYLFPASLGTPPHRHWRFSRVEVGVDLVFAFLWLGSSLRYSMLGACFSSSMELAMNGSGEYYMVSKKVPFCPTWIISVMAGFLCFFVYLLTILMGIVDLKHQGRVDAAQTRAIAMFARGNWKQ